MIEHFETWWDIEIVPPIGARVDFENQSKALTAEELVHLVGLVEIELDFGLRVEGQLETW